MSEPLQTLILRRLAQVKNKRVAEALGCDESTVSRILSGQRGIHLEEIDTLFRVLGIVGNEVGSDAMTLPSEEVRALQVLARKGLQFLGGEGEK